MTSLCVRNSRSAHGITCELWVRSGDGNEQLLEELDEGYTSDWSGSYNFSWTAACYYADGDKKTTCVKITKDTEVEFSYGTETVSVFVKEGGDAAFKLATKTKRENTTSAGADARSNYDADLILDFVESANRPYPTVQCLSRDKKDRGQVLASVKNAAKKT